MRINVLDLCPTQMALGMREVDERIDKLSDMKESERDDYVMARKVPVVLGPNGRVYLVDHHHLARACWELDHEEMKVDVVGDLSKLAYAEFWKKLDDNHWIHLYDQFGNGPYEPKHLPRNVRCMADDPFRSLAWVVRERGGFMKSPLPFCEFQWADFLRKNVKNHPVFDGREPAIAEAMALAKSPAAAVLPGWLGSGKAP